MDLMWISGYESELDARRSLDMAYSASPPAPAPTTPQAIAGWLGRGSMGIGMVNGG